MAIQELLLVMPNMEVVLNVQLSVNGIRRKSTELSKMMNYPKFNCPRRTDETFRNKTDEDHHKEDTPLTDLPITMMEDFEIADSLHLFDLSIH